MKHFTMFSALAHILDPIYSTSFEVKQVTPDANGQMMQYPEMTDLTAEDVDWITKAIEGDLPGFGCDGLFEVSAGGEACIGYMVVYYSDQGDVLRVYSYVV